MESEDTSAALALCELLTGRPDETMTHDNDMLSTIPLLNDNNETCSDMNENYCSFYSEIEYDDSFTVTNLDVPIGNETVVSEETSNNQAQSGLSLGNECHQNNELSVNDFEKHGHNIILEK
jgi:hypothetical protein